MKSQMMRPSVRGLFGRLVIFIVLGTCLLEVFIHITGYGDVDYTNIDDVSVTIKKANGEKKTADSMYFDLLDKGDEVTITLRIPNRITSEPQYLCFYQYHSLITVSTKDGVRLGTFGRKELEAKDMPGNQFCAVNIPKQYAGTYLTIRVYQVEGSHSNHYTQFRMMPATQVRLYPLIHNKLYLLVFESTLIVSIFAFLAVLIGQIVHRKWMPMELSLALFVFSISVWQLSSRRLFYVMIRNQRLCATAQYFAIFFAPIALFFFLAELKEKKLPRMIYQTIACLFTGNCIANCILHFGLNDHIINRENQMYALLAASLVLVLIMEAFIFREKQNFVIRIIRFGTVLSIVLFLTKFFMNYIRRTNLPEGVYFLLEKIDFASIAITTFTISLVCALYFKFQKTIEDQIRKEQTEYMAYHDSLTGLYNRNYAEEWFDQLDMHKEKEYAIFFLDADNLKNANDNYGHKTGDQLIQTTGSIIQSVIPENGGFVCRWGGDEFLLFISDIHKVPEVSKQLNLVFQETREAEIFPFHYSVSFGVATHKAGDSSSSSDVRSLADQRMYNNKRQKKAVR